MALTKAQQQKLVQDSITSILVARKTFTEQSSAWNTAKKTFVDAYKQCSASFDKAFDRLDAKQAKLLRSIACPKKTTVDERVAKFAHTNLASLVVYLETHIDDLKALGYNLVKAK